MADTSGPINIWDEIAKGRALIPPGPQPPSQEEIAQRLTWQRENERRNAEIIRKRDEARRLAAKAKAAIERESAARWQAHSEQLEAQEKEKALQAWVNVGGLPAAFEKAWPDMYQEIIEERQEEAKRYGPAYHAF